MPQFLPWVLAGLRCGNVDEINPASQVAFVLVFYLDSEKPSDAVLMQCSKAVLLVEL